MIISPAVRLLFRLTRIRTSPSRPEPKWLKPRPAIGNDAAGRKPIQGVARFMVDVFAVARFGAMEFITILDRCNDTGDLYINVDGSVRTTPRIIDCMSSTSLNIQP